MARCHTVVAEHNVCGLPLLQQIFEATDTRMAIRSHSSSVNNKRAIEDKGYRADWIDEYLLNLGIEPVIPSRENEDRTTRPVEFDREAYRRRNIIERLIGWLKESRRIFSRFEKTAKNFGGMLKLAFIRQYLTYELD